MFDFLRRSSICIAHKCIFIFHVDNEFLDPIKEEYR